LAEKCESLHHNDPKIPTVRAVGNGAGVPVCQGYGQALGEAVLKRRRNSSIRQFELRDRHLTPDATCNLTKFVQTNANRFGSHVFNRAVCRTVPLMHQELVVATMLNGSALEKLELRGLLSPSESAFYFVTNDSNIRLQRLILHGTAVSGSNLRSLCQHLVTTSTLQYLYLTLLDVKEDAQSLAEGLRQNGSLVPAACQRQ
jgi:hypothetical protein